MMAHIDVIGLFAQDAVSCPPSIDRAMAALSDFIGRHHLTLSPVDVETLIGVGGHLIHHNIDEWWNSASASPDLPYVVASAVGASRIPARVTKNTQARRTVSLHEIQMMVINRQRRYDVCDKLVFDAAYWKQPDIGGTNWDIEPVPSRSTKRGGVPYDCFCVMESYFYHLQSRFDVHGTEEK